MRRAAALAVALGALGPPADAAACAVAPPDRARVVAGAEQALVVWSAATETEHFVRTVAFDADAQDFGFLVPTPSAPELGEVPADVFERLEPLTRAPVEVFDTVQVSWGCMDAFLRGERAGAPKAAAGLDDGVRVLSTARVAGLDATVLQADSAGALERWLAERRYPIRPELARWLAGYVAQRWTITAFRIDAGGAPDALPSGAIRPRALRMSFRARRPFFPYREPAPAEGEPRRARPFALFVVTDERVSGRVGGAAWSAHLEYADRPDGLDALLAPALPAGAPVPRWLHLFTEAVPVRPPADLEFERASEQERRLPPPVRVPRVRRLWIPVELALLVPPIALLLLRRRRAR